MIVTDEFSKEEEHEICSDTFRDANRNRITITLTKLSTTGTIRLDIDDDCDTATIILSREELEVCKDKFNSLFETALEGLE